MVQQLLSAKGLKEQNAPMISTNTGAKPGYVSSGLPVNKGLPKADVVIPNVTKPMGAIEGVNAPSQVQALSSQAKANPALQQDYTKSFSKPEIQQPQQEQIKVEVEKGKNFPQITMQQETALKTRLKEKMPNATPEERYAEAQRIISKFAPQKEATSSIDMPSVIGGGTSLGLGLGGLGLSKILRNPEQFSQYVQDNVKKLKSRFVGGVKTEDREAIEEGSDIIAKYADEGTETFEQLVDNFKNIKTKYYTDTGLKNTFDSIKIPKGSQIYDRVDQITKSMLSSLKEGKGKVKIGLEGLYDDIVDVRDRLYKGELSGTDANEMKKKINEFFGVFTDEGQVKGGLTKKGAANIYNEIKSGLEDLAAKAGDANVSAKNKGYQSLLVIEDYLKKMANKVSTSSATAREAGLAERIMQKAMQVADFIPGVSSAKGAIQGAIKGFGLGGTTRLSPEEIQKQIPMILDRIKKTTKDDSVVKYVEDMIEKNVDSAVPIVKQGKGLLSKLKGGGLFTIVANVLYDQNNPSIAAFNLAMDSMDNPEDYYIGNSGIEGYDYIVPKDTVAVDESGYVDINGERFRVEGNQLLGPIQ